MPKIELFTIGVGIWSTDESKVTMKYQSTHDTITVNLLIKMVVDRVRSRFGERSIHLPTAEEKHMEAKVLTMPLKVH